MPITTHADLHNALTDAFYSNDIVGLRRLRQGLEAEPMDDNEDDHETTLGLVDAITGAVLERQQQARRAA